MLINWRTRSWLEDFQDPKSLASDLIIQIRKRSIRRSLDCKKPRGESRNIQETIQLQVGAKPQGRPFPFSDILFFRATGGFGFC